jgi:hypothetical protein
MVFGHLPDFEDRRFTQLLDKGLLHLGHRAGSAAMQGMRHLAVMGRVVGLRRDGGLSAARVPQ